MGGRRVMRTLHAPDARPNATATVTVTGDIILSPLRSRTHVLGPVMMSGSDIPTCDTTLNGGEGNSLSRESERWICSLCKTPFTTRGSLMRHQERSSCRAGVTQEDGVCVLCSSRFRRRDDLYAHLRRVHGRDDLALQLIENHKRRRERNKRQRYEGGDYQLACTAQCNDQKGTCVLSRSVENCTSNRRCDAHESSSSSSSPSPPRQDSAHEERPTVAPLEPVSSRNADGGTHEVGSRAHRDKVGLRIKHDDHEDVLIGNFLRHFDETSQSWTAHGELSVDDLDLLSPCLSPPACHHNVGNAPQLWKLVTHDQHLDVVSPTGKVFCLHGS